jgi:hypothetical protein
MTYKRQTAKNIFVGNPVFINDGASASANTSYNCVAANAGTASGNVIGYVPVSVAGVSAYFLLWSGAAIE